MFLQALRSRASGSGDRRRTGPARKKSRTPSVEGLETRQLLDGGVGVAGPAAVMTPVVQSSFSICNYHKTVHLDAGKTRFVIAILNKAASAEGKRVIIDLLGRNVPGAVVDAAAAIGFKRIAGWFQAALDKSHGRGTTLDAGVSHCVVPFLHVNPR